MKFAELLQRYKDGTATEEEIREVEEEIEKNELINDFISQQLPELEGLSLLQEENQQEARKIASAVNRKLWKIICVVIAALTALALLINYVALPYYNSRFYDPYQIVKGVPDVRNQEKDYTNTFTPLFMNVDVFLDLYFPGWMAQQEKVYPLGMGEYDVLIKINNTFDGQEDFSARLSKGVIEQGIEKEWFFPTPTAGRFYEKGSRFFRVTFVDENGNETQEQQPDVRQGYREEMEKLPESVFIEAYITFEENMTVEELLKWKEEVPVTLTWAAVETGDDCYLGEVGFDVDMGGYVLEPTEEFEEMFPYLQVNSSNTHGEAETAEQFEQHYKSMLKYMSYQEEFLDAFCDVNHYNDAESYQKALDYAEENGINIYGAVVTGTRNDMMELEQRADIHSFQISNVKLSIYG